MFCNETLKKKTKLGTNFKGRFNEYIFTTVIRGECALY